MTEEIKENSDSLAEWSVFAGIYVIISNTIIGGIIGAIAAYLIAFPILKMLPVRSDGRKMPKWVSIYLIVISVVFFIALLFIGIMNQQ